MRKIWFCCLGLLTGCSSTSTSTEWREVQTNSPESRLERAKAVCQGDRATTQALAGRYWIMGAMAADTNFKACMANKGFVQG